MYVMTMINCLTIFDFAVPLKTIPGPEITLGYERYIKKKLYETFSNRRTKRVFQQARETVNEKI